MFAKSSKRVSFIIPARNEASCIVATLRSLRNQNPFEIVVVDGGSTDETVRLAQDADRVLVAPPGRALQMNAGAWAARGDILVFLHADCGLEPNSLQAVETALRYPDIIAGCFSMRIQGNGWMYRCIDACASARVRLMGIAYGDQGLFLRRCDFQRLGGFPPVGLMEDACLSRLLRRHGKIVVVSKKIFVSPRRWQRVGIIRQTLHNWALTARFLAGIHPDILANDYPQVR